MTNTLLLATRNPGKIKEIKNIIKDFPYNLKTLADIGFKDDIPETGKSFEENAILKAKIVGDKTGLLTLSEDAGLEIDALGGWPGIYSARHTKGTDWDKLQKVLEKMRGIPKKKRSAIYIAVVALYIPPFRHPEEQSDEGPRPLPKNRTGFFANAQNDFKKGKIVTFKGQAKGFITDSPEGTHGFGYDPIFWSSDLKKTFGNATDEEKNKVSHRARALNKLKKFLDKILLV